MKREDRYEFRIFRPPIPTNYRPHDAEVFAQPSDLWARRYRSDFAWKPARAASPTTPKAQHGTRLSSPNYEEHAAAAISKAVSTYALRGRQKAATKQASSQALKDKRTSPTHRSGQCFVRAP